MTASLRPLDLAALVLTIGGIAIYGMWKSRQKATASEFLSGQHQTHWLPMALGILATQASAITFLSTPGQGFGDGLRFAQFYLGMPLALFVLGAWVVPRYMHSGARTAYEYLEGVFGSRVRGLAALLFLTSRSLAAGITLYAPAIVLSALFGWNLKVTVLVIGAVVIVYTAFGGYKAVEVTQTAQMTVILLGLVAAFIVLLQGLPEGFGWSDVWSLNQAYGHTQILDFEWNPASRYTVWSGLAGGFFLAMAYFGTDQSQVGRYLGGKSLTEIRRGFLFTGLIKFPMQLFILSLGLLLLARMHFADEPLWHNPAVAQAWQGMRPDLDAQWAEVNDQRQKLAAQPATPERQARLAELHDRRNALKAAAVDQVKASAPHLETKDQDYIFLGWALGHMPVGLLGLLLAVIMAGAMSSSSAEINALAATSVIDFGRVLGLRETLQTSRWVTAFWGFAAMGVALLASLYENLIQLVNLIGSLFYGPMLGIFVCAWLFKRLPWRAVFWGGILAESAVLSLHAATLAGWLELGYLWYNLIGAVLVVALSWLLPFRAPRA
jgi:SSS family solute:Na+ symporter